MKFIGQTPEAPIIEEWIWSTNVLTSDNGTEQRISLLSSPKRTVKYRYEFDDDNRLDTFITSMFRSGAGVELPLWHRQSRLTAGAAPAALRLNLRGVTADLRPGDAAIVFDHTGRQEPVTIATIDSAGATLVDPTQLAWSRRASICPTSKFYMNGEANFIRNNPDRAGSAEISFTELGFIEPFLSPLNETPIELFNGLPVLNVNSIGTEFQNQIDTGSTVIGYGGVAQIRDRWEYAKFVMPRQFLCQRLLQPEVWAFWQTFAATVRGSCVPFYLPTFRQDFPLVSIGQAELRFEGEDYANDYAPYDPFRQFAIFLRGGGVHYAGVVEAVSANGDSVVTFNPPLPIEAEPLKVSMLMKVRIGDDRISCQHDVLETTLSINIRTAA